MGMQHKRGLPSDLGYRKRYPAHNNDTPRATSGIENDTQHSQNAHLFLHGYRKRYPATLAAYIICCEFIIFD